MANIYHTTADGYDGAVVISQSQTLLLGAIVENTSASTIWWQVFDGYVAPTSGQVPIMELQIATVSQGSLDLQGVHGEIVLAGLVVAASSTRGTYTAAAGSVWQTVFWSLV